MSTTITRKAVRQAAEAVTMATGDGVGHALATYVRAAAKAYSETGASAAVHGMHAARAAYLFASQTDGDGAFVFGTKSGRINVTAAWRDLVGPDVAADEGTAPAGLSRRMYANRVKAGQALADRFGSLADVDALEADAVAVFRDVVKAQRGNVNGTDGKGTDDAPQDDAPQDTPAEGKADDAESVGADVLADAQRLTSMIRKANGRMTEAEIAAVRAEVERMSAALGTIKPFVLIEA